jgi:hypothetical protein
MRVTNAYFQNILLPRAKAVAVCQTLCQWHIARGYQQVSGRRLFDYRDFHPGEKRAFVLSNEKWCVVLHSSDTENASDLRSAFAQFPAVVQLWAHDSAWGYRLEERGSRITAYCSKAVANLPDEPQARQPSDLQRLVAACGVPQASDRLRRLEKDRFLFVQKACAEFSDALEVPVAVSTFYDADQVNAGLAEARHSCGWNCQMLAFIKAPGAPSDPVLKLWPETLTAERRAEIIRQQANRRKRIRPGHLLLALANGLPSALLLTGENILSIFLWVLTMIPGLRPMLLGKATRFCDEFWKELQPAEPKRIQIRGELAINTRHSCSIIAPPPVQVLPKFQPRKPIPGHEPVFDIKMDPLFVSCMAYPSGQVLRRVGGDLLEERSFPVDAGSVDFVRRRVGREHQYYRYSWTVHAPKADYQFTSSAKEEMTSVQLEILENIVRSLKIEQEPRLNKI